MVLASAHQSPLTIFCQSFKTMPVQNPFSKNSSFTYLSHGINIGLTLFSVRSRESSKLITAKEKLKIPFSFADP